MHGFLISDLGGFNGEYFFVHISNLAADSQICTYDFGDDVGYLLYIFL